MCGIAGLHLKDDALRGQLGALVAGMLRGVAERGPDSAGVAIHGERLEVLKAVGDPVDFAAAVGLSTRTGVRALAHTRMATESAVTAAHCHPFTVDDDLCLVHNGSFANHATVRRRLAADGVRTETDNDSEVAARYLGARIAEGVGLGSALRDLAEAFDGFFTLAVTTADSFAVLRDPIGCKPAIIAETDAWVAVVSEYRALLGLPGLAEATVFEPEPEEVYLWAS